MDIGSTDAPRSPVQRLGVGKDFNAARPTFAVVDQLRRILATHAGQRS